MNFGSVSEGEWVTPRRKGYYVKCCDCGLVHRVDFKLIGTPKRRVIALRAFRVTRRDGACTARRERAHFRRGARGGWLLGSK